MVSDTLPSVKLEQTLSGAVEGSSSFFSHVFAKRVTSAKKRVFSVGMIIVR